MCVSEHSEGFLGDFVDTLVEKMPKSVIFDSFRPFSISEHDGTRFKKRLKDAYYQYEYLEKKLGSRRLSCENEHKKVLFKRIESIT